MKKIFLTVSDKMSIMFNVNFTGIFQFDHFANMRMLF